MPTSSKLTEIPLSRAPQSRLAVERAVTELRRGRMVALIGGGGQQALAMAAEGATEGALEHLTQTAGAASIVAVTRRRASVLGLTGAPPPGAGPEAVGIKAAQPFNAQTVMALADPLFDGRPVSQPLEVVGSSPFSPESAALQLAKTARLLPAAVVAPICDPDAGDLAGWTSRRDILLLDCGDVFQYVRLASHGLRQVAASQVPLTDAEDTRILAFRPEDGGLEHLAIVIGSPAPGQPVLARLHSECFTGDLLGSLRCDCGDQLRGTIREIAAAGAGVLLYLAQEGRGIGLVNKLRAYQLQDRGFDTLQANEQLGFDADERIYLPAANMLEQLGFDAVRLLTNNPAKVEALEHCGIRVVERVPHAFPSNRHNEHYLFTKRARGGHLF